ncbi:MAG: 16S rRNA (guanine(527)-N(7))-methyltransferase RsmG [Dehalococcoidia bacterium]
MKKLIEGAAKLGLGLSARQIQQFEVYYRELIEWNKKTNLTTIVDYESVQVKHFLDSLTVTIALSAESLTSPGFSVMDVGTGAGFPGVPLKILLPGIRLVLVESTTKKIAFLYELIGRLQLEGAEVVNSTAEEAARLPLYREGFSLVVSRALAPLPTLAELGLPFCELGGRFVAQKKGEIGDEVDKARAAIAALGGEVEQIRRIELDEFNDMRYLVIIRKTSWTPARYPRRPGVPRRRPIQEVNRHVV